MNTTFRIPITTLIAATCLLPAFAQAQTPSGVIHVKGGFVTAIKDVELAAKEPGILAEVIAKPGDEVRVGGLLGKMDDKDAVIRVEAATAELEVATTQAESEAEIIAAQHTAGAAKAEYQQSLDIDRAKKGVISETQLRRDELQWRRAVAQEEVAKMEHVMHGKTVLVKAAQLKAAQNDLEKRQIKSSINGIVEDIYKDEGEWCPLGERVARVVQMDRLRVVGFVSAKEGNQDNVLGRRVRIMVTVPNLSQPVEVFGIVDYASPIIANSEYRIHCDIENVQDPRSGRWAISPGVRADLSIDMSQPAVSRAAPSNLEASR